MTTSQDTMAGGCSPADHGSRRRAVVAAIGAVTLALAGVGLLASASDASGPDRLVPREGEIGRGQSVTALATQDQSGSDDDWDRYVELIPGDTLHRSVLSLTPQGDGSDRLDIELNYRGPDAGENRWRLLVRDWQAGRWVPVFDNADVADWAWTPAAVSLDDPARFLDGNGQVRLRYVSSNDQDVSQLDSLQVRRRDPASTLPPGSSGRTLPPAGAGFDYQIGGDYPLPAGTGVVSRDWFAGAPAPSAYTICYVNAFQTQPEETGVDRPDETSAWPADLVLSDLAQDPSWTGEYLIDLSTAAKRARAADWVAPMVQACKDKGFDAVEFDNLDSWTRFEEIPSIQARMPFRRPAGVAFAGLITEHAHGLGLAVAQKNTPQLIDNGDHESIGFDFAVAEECGQYRECGDYTAGYDDHVIDIEYSATGFRRACAGFGSQLSIVRRDVGVSTPQERGYVFDRC